MHQWWFCRHCLRRGHHDRIGNVVIVRWAGEEVEQVGQLATAGRARVLHEFRGPKGIVADIRLKGSSSGNFQVPYALILGIKTLRHLSS